MIQQNEDDDADDIQQQTTKYKRLLSINFRNEK